MSIRERANKAKPNRCKSLIAVLENPKTLENVGSVIRNVDALGVGKLYIVDGFNMLPSDWQTMRERKTLNKLSVSAIKWVYVHKFSNTKACLDYLKKNRFVSVVTSPHQKGKINVSLDDAKLTHKHLAIWFGNESHGVSDEAVQASEFCINIPMNGIIESLNLGSCSSVVLYEATKQRRKFKKQKLCKQS